MYMANTRSTMVVFMATCLSVPVIVVALLTGSLHSLLVLPVAGPIVLWILISALGFDRHSSEPKYFLDYSNKCKEDEHRSAHKVELLKRYTEVEDKSELLAFMCKREFIE